MHPQIDMLLTPAATLLLLLAGLVLVIACSNLATLLLVRGSARAREVAVRLALGATRGQLVRHLLAENLVLALAGGGVGCLLAYWLLDLVALAGLPLVTDLVLDYRVLGFALLLSLATGVGTGLVPARGAARVDVVPELKNGTGTPLSLHRRWRTPRNAVGVGQMAAAVVLLVAGGMVLQALFGAQRVNLGYDVDNVAVIETDAAWAGYDTATAPAVYEAVRARIAALPGVESATLAASSPFDGVGSRILEIPGYATPDASPASARLNWAGPRLFETLGIPVVEGRTFSAFDGPDARSVVMVNQSMARRYFGGATAVGRRFRIASAPGPDIDASSGLDVEVIGVVADTRQTALEALQPTVYLSFVQDEADASIVMARTAGPPAALLQPMREALQAVDPELPMLSASTLRQQADATLNVPRATGALLGALGLIGLALASLGLYAVVAFAVTRRSVEVGIRMALGATRGQVVWALSRDVTRLLVVGVAVGLTLSLAGVQALGVLAANLSEAPNLEIAQPTASPVALVAVALLMFTVGLVAVLLPASRAARTQSMTALRDL
jgi:predicted permease